MTRPRRSRIRGPGAPGGRSRSPFAPPRRPGKARRVLGGALVLVLLAAAALVLRSRPSARPPDAARQAAVDDCVLRDSLAAADARQDWVAAVLWAERLGVRHPREHAILLARGTAWSNYARAQRPARALPRPALRTSLERIACEARALALMDSAGMFAPDTTRWMDAMVRLAQLEETMGLAGDALLAYETIKRLAPQAYAPALRAYWLRAVFYDPVRPDTSEWDRLQRALGRR